jgi:DNA-binding PucR family transcriptional regulator
MAAEHAELTRGAHAERRAAVTLLLEGAPIARDRAEARLGYGLTGPHTAAIVWSGTGTAGPDSLEAAAEAVMRAVGADRRLTVVAGAASPAADELTARLSDHPDVRVAVGRPGRDVDGFRRSHLDAATAQRMVARLTSRQQVARFQDVALVALLTREPAQAEEFLADTLGGLLDADDDTRAAVLTYVLELGSTSRTAHRLYTHRNTVLRRLARADDLLPRPLAEDPLGVAAALQVLRWRGTGR